MPKWGEGSGCPLAREVKAREVEEEVVLDMAESGGLKENIIHLFTLLLSVYWLNCFCQTWFHMVPLVDMGSFRTFYYKSVAEEKRGL